MRTYVQQVWKVLKDMGAWKAMKYLTPHASTTAAVVVLAVLVFLFPENQWSQFNRDSDEKLITTSETPSEEAPVAPATTPEPAPATVTEQTTIPQVTQTEQLTQSNQPAEPTVSGDSYPQDNNGTSGQYYGDTTQGGFPDDEPREDTRGDRRTRDYSTPEFSSQNLEPTVTEQTPLVSPSGTSPRSDSTTS